MLPKSVNQNIRTRYLCREKIKMLKTLDVLKSCILDNYNNKKPPKRSGLFLHSSKGRGKRDSATCRCF